MEDVLFYGFQEGGWAMAYVTGINLQEVKNMGDIHIKTAVGLIGDSIVKTSGFKQQAFPYVFNVVDSIEEDRW